MKKDGEPMMISEHVRVLDNEVESFLGVLNHFGFIQIKVLL